MNVSKPTTTTRLGWPDMVGTCIVKQQIYDSYSIFSTVVEFFVVVVLTVCGLMANYNLWNALKEEKKNKPIGRKGNVIEPIVSWYCIIQSVFWPYLMFNLWIVPNQVITVEGSPAWLIYIGLQSAYLGRTYIAFNSLCCATIRYWYIDHQEKAKQWDHERTRRNFQLASVFLPLILQIVAAFTAKYAIMTAGNKRFEDCMVLYDDLYLGRNSTEKLPRVPSLYLLTTNVVPIPIVETIYIITIAIAFVIYSNGIEAYLYFKISQTIKG